jgi:tetratricopeptide (TPR) repeat protein
LQGKRVIAQERSLEQNELKLTGLVSVAPVGYLKTRNRIYQHVFDQKWVTDNIHATTVQKVAVVMTIVALAAIVTSAFLYWRAQNQATEVLAQTYTQGFLESGSPEVRITNLAGLFELGGEYQQQARELFFGQAEEVQLALFKLVNPQNVGNELVSVVEGVYQYAPDDQPGNALLAAMSESLSQVAASGAPSLATEIEFWLQARDLAAEGQDEPAVTLFDRVIEQSLNRDHENAAALIDRARAYTRIGQYEQGLESYDRVLELDVGRVETVQAAILGDEELADYWRENYDSFANLSRLIDKPTEIPVAAVSSPTFKATPFPSAISTPQISSASSPPSCDEIGQIWISPVDGMELSCVPAREFKMGSTESELSSTPGLGGLMVRCSGILPLGRTTPAKRSRVGESRPRYRWAHLPVGRRA